MNDEVAPQQPCCMECRHFRNSPQYLEAQIKGWAVMGSAHGSVRKDDGICLLNDVYLSARDWCDRFAPVHTDPDDR